jgi:hypothetical protein
MTLTLLIGQQLLCLAAAPLQNMDGCVYSTETQQTGPDRTRARLRTTYQIKSINKITGCDSNTVCILLWCAAPHYITVKLAPTKPKSAICSMAVEHGCGNAAAYCTEHL